MMFENPWFLYSYITLFPAIAFFAGLYSMPRLESYMKPIVWVAGIAFLSECTRSLMMLNYYLAWGWPIEPSLIGYNLYVLGNGLLLTTWFRGIGLFAKTPRLYYGIMVGLTAVWIGDHFFWEGIRIFDQTRFYRLVYASVLSLLTIQQINVLLVHSRQSLLKNPVFIVCCAVVLFFIPYIITECIAFFVPDTSLSFKKSVFNYRKLIHPVIYLLYTLALLWTPTKKKFIQLS